MKIVGGSFGVKGSAFISRDKKLVIEAVKPVNYSREQISRINTTQVKEKRFGAFGFIIGAILLAIILGVLFGVIGAIVGVVAAVFGSFYSDSKNIVELFFVDQNQVTLECTPRAVNKLVTFAGK